MRVVFFGTPEFAVPSLAALAAAHDVVLVVTQPDRPAGRGLQLRATPVMEHARRASLDVRAPLEFDAAFIAEVASLRPQLIACASYGKILPKALLEIPGAVALNVHPSMLPDYRGASPIQAALRDGRASTGVTIFWMAPAMDAGDIALQESVDIDPHDDFGRLHDRLAAVGARLLAEAARLLGKGTLPRVPQDHARATFTAPIRKEDLRIRDGTPAREIVDLVRSASPAPGAWTILDGARIKVLQARVEPLGTPATTADGPSLAAPDGVVRLLRLVPEGRRAMTGAEFVRATQPRR